MNRWPSILLLVNQELAEVVVMVVVVMVVMVVVVMSVISMGEDLVISTVSSSLRVSVLCPYHLLLPNLSCPRSLLWPQRC